MYTLIYIYTQSFVPVWFPHVHSLRRWEERWKGMLNKHQLNAWFFNLLFNPQWFLSFNPHYNLEQKRYLYSRFQKWRNYGSKRLNGLSRSQNRCKAKLRFEATCVWAYPRLFHYLTLGFPKSYFIHYWISTWSAELHYTKPLNKQINNLERQTGKQGANGKLGQ